MCYFERMKPIPLDQFVQQIGSQVKAGRELGLAQCTISLMLSNQRQIFVIPTPAGGWSHYEIVVPAGRSHAA